MESLIPKLLSSPKGRIVSGNNSSIELTALHHHHHHSSSTAGSTGTATTTALDLSTYSSPRWVTPCGVRWSAFDVLAVMVHSLLSRLRVPGHEMPPVVVVQSPLSPESYSRRVSEMMFGMLGVPRFAAVPHPVATLYAMAKESGLVIDCGYSATTISPVYRGRVISEAVSTLNVGGRHLTEYLLRLSGTAGPSGPQYPQRTHSQKISRICAMKEQYGFTAIDTDTESELKESTSTSSKQKVHCDFVALGRECPEPLFSPHFVGSASPGIHELVARSLLKCESAVREELLSGMVLSGGSTLFDGLDRRLERELQRILFGQHLVDAFLSGFAAAESVVRLIYEFQGVAAHRKRLDHWRWLKVAAPSDRRYSAWVGGAEMAQSVGSTPTAPRWINRQQYDSQQP